MKYALTSLFVLNFLCGALPPLFAEVPSGNRFTAITTTDTSELGLARPLQDALAKLAANTRLFQVTMADYSLTGFTSKTIAEGFERFNSNILGFVYIEKSRISIFFFDRKRPAEFIVSSKLLTDPPGGTLTSEFIEARFKAAFQNVVKTYLKGEYQPLPGSKVDLNQLKLAELQESRQKASEARKLFRELAALEYRPIYVGASVGMSRFSNGSNPASTVEFGGFGGYRPSPNYAFEIGLDVFSYAFLHADARYQIPWAEKYVSISASAGVARCMKHLNDNEGFANTSDRIPVGSMGVGPGFALDIPLLGANLRGEVRYYFGSSPLLVGSYGILYSL